MRYAFRFIQWTLKILFRIIWSLVKSIFGFKSKPARVKFTGKVITDKTFQILNSAFAKDSMAVHYKSYILNDADLPTFEALDEHYAKDKFRAYYCDEHREGQNYYLTKKPRIFAILHTHIPTFVSLGHGYAKDEKNAYFLGTAFQVKQVSTLVVLNTHFAKDDISAYLNRQPIAGSHGKTFELLDGNFASDRVNHYYYAYPGQGAHQISVLPCDESSFKILDYRYSRDDIHVFFLGFTLEGADAGSFQILAEGYAKDKGAVYYQQRKVTGADAGTFEVYQENGMYGHDVSYARDHGSVFMDDVRVDGADVPTFKVLGENYASDQQNVYYKSKVVKGANPGTFIVYPHDVGNADSEDAFQKFHEGAAVRD